MKEYSQPLDHRLERALDHPTRRAILDLLMGQKGVGSNSISGKLGIRPANAGYHLDVLTASGAIEVVEGERRGERLVRLPQSSAKRKANPLGASGSRRDDVSEAQLRSLIEMAAHLRPGHAPGTGA